MLCFSDLGGQEHLAADGVRFLSEGYSLLIKAWHGRPSLGHYLTPMCPCPAVLL